MAALWSNRSKAPTTVFVATLSPRQIATKALTLGCKKLDRDDRRRKPKYSIRERLLLCITISNAEEVLNKRTRRTNRRVMDAEEDLEDLKQHAPSPKELHSPLRSLVITELEPTQPQPPLPNVDGPELAEVEIKLDQALLLTEYKLILTPTIPPAPIANPIF
ncbi:hypothetical protein J3Q64DRAFT_1223494 [Phycomyces blakesleeanus]|uniref:Uncharacterized protein n=1 Tax=Phycomyces blakesleeanus TaxID=4837 RepID=A0ABR3BAP6_PHYBL